MALKINGGRVNQPVRDLYRCRDRNALESFAEHGPWRTDSVTCGQARLIDNSSALPCLSHSGSTELDENRGPVRSRARVKSNLS